MQKIGVLTWHHFDNYGGVLQSYALSTKIKQFDKNCEIINYRNVSRLKFTVLNNSFLLTCANLVLNSANSVNFNKFRKKYLKQSKFYNRKTIFRNADKDYDKIIVGSDQIWSPNVLDSTYLLDWVSDDSKKFSYAASSVVETSDNEKIKLFNECLNKFQKISVREQKSKENIESYTGRKDCQTVLDPTLLLDEEDYNEIISEKIVPHEEYVLCYFLGENEHYSQIVDSIKGDLPVYSIMANKNSCGFGNKIYNAGPEDFLGLIKNCKSFITDSFHGVAFSIIFKKDFYVLERFKKDSTINQNPRIDHILSLLNLQDRKIITIKNLDCKPINYDKVYENLKKERSHSLKYLKECLDIKD